MILRFLRVAVCALPMAIILNSQVETDDPLETNESHPFQDKLICERAPGGTLVGVMYDVRNGGKKKIGQFTSGHVGACELAVRAARNDLVCLQRNWSIAATKISTQETVKTFGSDLNACLAYTRGWDSLTTQSGYVDFMDPNEQEAMKELLPQLADTKLNDAMRSSRTMWYDDNAMVFVYQDSFGDPKGLRANRVGYDVGSNSSVPDIRLLVNYFKPGKFRFPFGITAGADFHESDHVLYFWQPPVKNGKTLPVKYWKNRSHFHWTFPVGTIFGEVLMINGPKEKDWHVFEVRVRERLKSSWKTSIFRPFVNAKQMAQAIQDERPNWQETDLKALVNHLLDNTTLVDRTLDTEYYGKIVPDFKGSADYLPGTKDTALIHGFLKNRVFQDVMGTSWKKGNGKETFAAATKADFHIVPRDYIGGMFGTTEKACMTCHEHSGRPFKDLDSRVVLYGEIWGEDQIFTWHPFEIGTDSFTVSDGSRRINKRLLSSGLLVREKPSSSDPNYEILPLPYRPDYE